MSTIIITEFTPSEAYKADPSCINEGMALISGCEGVVANYHGLRIQGGDVAYTIQVATTPEAFLAVVNDAELYPRILKAMEVTRVGEIEHFFFVPVSDPFKALVGPVTEITIFTLKSPESKAAIEGHGAKFNAATGGKMTFGWSATDPNTAIGIAAWDSVEAFYARAAEPDAAEGLGAIKELATVRGGQPFHVALTKTS